MKHLVLLTLCIAITGCAAGKRIVIEGDLTTPAVGHCENVDPIPTRIFSMEPLLQSAILSGKQYNGNNKILVLFDIDNTLLAAEELLGSDQWFTLKEEQGVEFSCLLDAQKLLYESDKMRLTHSGIPRVIKELSDKGFPLAVLTSRGPQVQSVTLRDLFDNSLIFDTTSPVGWIDEKYKDTSRDIKYEQGVFLTSGLHKGEMARYLLEKANAINNTKKVIFVDDKPKHVCRVQNSMQAIGMDVEVFHYPVEDYRVKPVQDRDPSTMNLLSTNWQTFLSKLNCRTKHCAKSLNRCQTEWNKY